MTLTVASAYMHWSKDAQKSTKRKKETQRTNLTHAQSQELLHLSSHLLVGGSTTAADVGDASNLRESVRLCTAGGREYTGIRGAVLVKQVCVDKFISSSALVVVVLFLVLISCFVFSCSCFSNWIEMDTSPLDQKRTITHTHSRIICCIFKVSWTVANRMRERMWQEVSGGQLFRLRCLTSFSLSSYPSSRTRSHTWSRQWLQIPCLRHDAHTFSCYPSALTSDSMLLLALSAILLQCFLLKVWLENDL